jgi:hypothetical protein
VKQGVKRFAGHLVEGKVGTFGCERHSSPRFSWKAVGCGFP